MLDELRYDRPSTIQVPPRCGNSRGRGPVGISYGARATLPDPQRCTNAAKHLRRLQRQEELGHANRFFKYVVERGGKVTLQAIAQPKCDFKSPLEAFKASLGHEEKVSAAICAIYELATTEKDYATVSFLKWFLDEQGEEEKTVAEIIAKLELIGDNRNGLFQIDSQAAKRAGADEKS